MSIAYLADHPEYLPIVAGWVYGYWGHLLPGANLEMIERRFHTHLNRDILPLTVIALAEGQPVGHGQPDPGGYVHPPRPLALAGQRVRRPGLPRPGHR